MNNFCKTFQSPCKPSQALMMFHITRFPLSEFCHPCDCGQISENIFFFLNLIMQKIFFDKNHWFQFLSTKNDWIISLFLISIAIHSIILHISQPFHHVFFLLAKKQPLTFDENFIATSQRESPNVRKFCFSDSPLPFFRFFRFRFLAYWDHYWKFSRFDSLKPPQNVLIKLP